MANHISKDDLLVMFNDMLHNWNCLKGSQQDVTTENFVDNVTYTLRWVIDSIEDFPCIGKDTIS